MLDRIQFELTASVETPYFPSVISTHVQSRRGVSTKVTKHRGSANYAASGSRFTMYICGASKIDTGTRDIEKVQ